MSDMKVWTSQGKREFETLPVHIEVFYVEKGAEGRILTSLRVTNKATGVEITKEFQ